MQSPKVLVKMDLRKLIISAHHLSPGLYTRLLHGLAARLLEMTFLVLLEYNFVAQWHHFQNKNLSYWSQKGCFKYASNVLRFVAIVQYSLFL